MKLNKHNHYFSDEYSYAGQDKTKTNIHLTYYNDNILHSNPVNINTKSFKSLIKEDCINWLKVQGLNDAEAVKRIVKEFGLHSLDTRDILTPNHVVKIDNEKNHLLIILNSSYLNDNNKIHSEYICIAIIENVVITFTESSNPIFKNVDKSLRSNTMHIREEKSGMLLAFLLNSILAKMIETSIQIEENLVKIEDILLKNQYKQGDIGSKIQKYRHIYLIIRKSIQPLKEDFWKLLKPKEGIIEKKIIHVFNDLSEQLEYIIQTTENSKEILTSLMDLYVSNNDLRTNAIMKRLTIVSTLFIPITFLVGVWGMNFILMPELDWKYGYAFAWGVLLMTGIGTWIFMKKKKWF